MVGSDLNEAVDGQPAVSYLLLPELSQRSRTDNAAVDAAGIGVAEQLLVHVLIMDRLAEGVYPDVVFSLSGVSSEHVKHLLYCLLRISALLDNEDHDGDMGVHVLHTKEPSWESPRYEFDSVCLYESVDGTI